MQFAIQYHTRNIESRLLKKVEKLVTTGQTVVVEGRDELEHKVLIYFNEFLPYFFHTSAPVNMVNLCYKRIPKYFGKYKPKGTGIPTDSHYLVSRKPQVRGYRLIAKMQDDLFWSKNVLLVMSYNVSKLFQFKNKPYICLDSGTQPMKYAWYLYENDKKTD